MPRFFVKKEQESEKEINIIGEDIIHIKNVLRKQIGDILEICNEDTGNVYKCKIFKINDNIIATHKIEKIQVEDNNIKIDIYQGLPKFDKMELIIQKSVELGANAIIPLKMKRCVVKIDEKSENKKIERWQKIAESAAKQSGRDIIPQIANVTKIDELAKRITQYDIVIVCYENEQKNKLKTELLQLKNNMKEHPEIKIAVVIGPEGGLEENEVELLKQNGAKVVTLGKRILRTETVALNVLSIIMYEFES